MDQKGFTWLTTFLRTGVALTTPTNFLPKVLEEEEEQQEPREVRKMVQSMEIVVRSNVPA